MHLCQRIIQSSKHFLNVYFPQSTSVLAANSLLCLLSFENGCLEVVIWVLEREKSAEAISGKYAGCSMIFVEFLAFTRLSFWRKFRSFRTSRAATRFIPVVYRQLSQLTTFWVYLYTYMLRCSHLGHYSIPALSVAKIWNILTTIREHPSPREMPDLSIRPWDRKSVV